MFIYRHKPSISKLILDILHNKDKDEKIGFNKLMNKVDDRLYPNKNERKKKQITSTTDFSTNLDHLLSWNLVKNDIYEYVGKYPTYKKRQVRNNYSLTEMGEVYFKFGYDPNQITNIIKIILLMCNAALYGVPKLRKISNKSNEKIDVGSIIIPTENCSNLSKNKKIPVNIYTTEKQEGISNSEVIEGKYKNIHPLFSDVIFDKYEAQQCLDFLLENKILKPIMNKNGEERFVLSNDQIKEFIRECVYNLYDFIELRLIIKIEYQLRNVNSVEEKWLLTHVGKKKFDKITSYRNRVRNGIKSGKLKQSDSNSKKFDKIRISNMNRQIVESYQQLTKKSESLSGTSIGMLHLMLSFICPKEFIHMIKKELEAEKNF